MKKLYSVVGLAFCLLACGCTNLHEEILNEQDNSQVITDPNNAKMLAAPAYASMRDFMDTGGLFALTETSTDECVFPSRGSDWNDVNNRTLFWHTYDATNEHVKNGWNALMSTLTRSNVAINYLSELEQTEEVKGYINEVKFIRALSMYYLMDYWGHFPMRESDATDFSALPQILDRPAALERIISELNEIIPNLKQKGEVPYGRITKAAAQTLLAHIYLNYQVFTGTAPEFTDGQAEWDKVIDLCTEIINSGKYKFSDDYWKLYLSDNSAEADATEAILPFVYDQSLGVSGQSWLNVTLHYSQNFGHYSFWNGCCTTPTFLDTWDKTDPRYTDSRLKSQIGFNIGMIEGQQYSISGEALKDRKDNPLIYTPDFKVDGASETEGVRVLKYAPDPNYAYGSGSDNDVMFYKYSDIYLMRGEARFRKGDVEGALQDINTVRAARGVKEYTAQTLTLESFYNKRGYEFYWDSMSRRDDMVRFNKYCGARYNVEACDKHFILFPIPQSALEANGELKQNEEY